MTSTRMRPVFVLELPLPADEAAQRMRFQMGASEESANSTVSGRFADLKVDEAERRIWSPQLSIQITESANGSQLRGRFSPRPDLWTFVMFVYFLMAFLMLFGAALGYVQWTMGDRAWGLFVVPAGGLVILGLHLASRVGQRLANEQMRQLRKRLDDMVAGAIDSLPTGG